MSKKEYDLDWEDDLEPVITLIPPGSSDFSERIKSFAKAKEKAIEGIWASLREYIQKAESEIQRVNELKEEDVE